MTEPQRHPEGDHKMVDFAGMTALSLQVLGALYFMLMLSAVLPPPKVWGWAVPVVAMPVLSILTATKGWLWRWPLVFMAGLALQAVAVALFVFVRP